MKSSRLSVIMFVTAATLLSVSYVTYADSPLDDEPKVKADIQVDGKLKLNIRVSGSSELSVDVKGPAQVSINAGDEVKLGVDASDESQVLIERQDVNEPAIQQETRYDTPSVDLDNSSLELNNPITRLNNCAIILAAFPAVGLLAFYLIRHSIEHGKTKQSNERR